MSDREDKCMVRALGRAVIWSAVWSYLRRHRECAEMPACVCGRARGHRKRCPLVTFYKVGIALDGGANLKKAEGDLNPPIPRATAKRDRALTVEIYRNGKLAAFDCGLLQLPTWTCRQHRRSNDIVSELAECAGIDPEKVDGYESDCRPVAEKGVDGGVYSSSEARALLLRAMRNVPPKLAEHVLVALLLERVRAGMLKKEHRASADE